MPQIAKNHSHNPFAGANCSCRISSTSYETSVVAVMMSLRTQHASHT